MANFSATAYASVFFASMLPVWELKGSIVAGTGFGMPIWQVFWLAWLGSCVPVPFIVLLIERVIQALSKSKVKLFNRVAGWILRKVDSNKGKIEKYGYLGIFAFVAIPLPGTGVWTGSLLAATLGLQAKKAIPLIMLGNLVAGFCMLLLSNLFFPHVSF